MDSSNVGAGQLAPVTWLFQPRDPGPLESTAPANRLLENAVLENPVLENATSRNPAGKSRARRDGFDPICTVSMSALARRGMSAEEMYDYLLARDFDDGDVELECERLIRVGLLDDLALATTLAQTLRDRKGLGRSALVAELRRRRIDQDSIEDALEDLDDPDDELARAIAIAGRRAPQLKALDQATARRRLGAFLMRKGYSGSVVSAAVAHALAPASGPVFR